MTSPAGPQASGDRLALLYHLAQTFNSSLDLNQVLNRVIDEVIIATHAERGFVMLYDNHHTLLFKVARGIDQQVINDPGFQVSRSIVDRVAQEGQAVMTFDAQTDNRFSMRESIMMLGLRSILCVPLSLKDKILGVIYVDNRLQAGIFTQPDLDLLSAIASNAAIAIENARLYQVAVEKGRLERELQMARQVQASLLPTEAPKAPGWEFIARWTPARQVAGDYYDFFQDKDGLLNLVVADVSDKGMPAALYMALTRTTVRASMDGAASPADGITRSNHLISTDSTQGMFVTLFYASLDLLSGEMTYVNAGHNPPLDFKPRGDHQLMQPLRLAPTGPALGILEDEVYNQNTIQIAHGEFILFYTDGVTEAQNAQGELFGIERLRQVILDHGAGSAGEFVSVLEKALALFTGDVEPFDDITLVAVKRL